MLVSRAFPKMQVFTKSNGSLNYRSHKVALTLDFPVNVLTIFIVSYGNAQ